MTCQFYSDFYKMYSHPNKEELSRMNHGRSGLQSFWKGEREVLVGRFEVFVALRRKATREQDITQDRIAIDVGARRRTATLHTNGNGYRLKRSLGVLGCWI